MHTLHLIQVYQLMYLAQQLTDVDRRTRDDTEMWREGGGADQSQSATVDMTVGVSFM